MENAVAVHVVDGFEHLVEVVLDSGLWEVVSAPFDGFIHVHVHQLEDQGQPSGRLVAVKLLVVSAV